MNTARRVWCFGSARSMVLHRIALGALGACPKKKPAPD